MYNIKDIIFQKYNDQPKEVTIQDLQTELKQVKKEVKELKSNQEKDREQLKQLIKLNNDEILSDSDSDDNTKQKSDEFLLML